MSEQQAYQAAQMHSSLPAEPVFVTTIPNQKELVLRVRYDSTRIPTAYLTDALGETMRSFDGLRIDNADPIIEADEVRGPLTGDFDWSFDNDE